MFLNFVFLKVKYTQLGFIEACRGKKKKKRRKAILLIILIEKFLFNLKVAFFVPKGEFDKKILLLS